MRQRLFWSKNLLQQVFFTEKKTDTFWYTVLQRTEWIFFFFFAPTKFFFLTDLFSRKNKELCTAVRLFIAAQRR